MANVRHFGPTVQLDSGLIIPAGSPAKGKVWTASDNEGHGSWATVAGIEEHAWVLQGEFAPGKLPGYSVGIASGQTKTLVAVSAYIQTGVSCVVSISRNGTGIENLTSLTVTKTNTETKPTSNVALSSKDTFALEIVSVKEAPVGLSVTLWVLSEP